MRWSRRPSAGAVPLVVALAVTALVACAPDDTDTAFRCDASRGCPSGQSCEFGRCRRGGAVGEVACGSVTCTTAEQCCVDLNETPRCAPATDVCGGRSALCDGIEDCQTGDRCCSDETTACGATCDEVACVTDDDCPAAAPYCCEALFVPWGECKSRSC